MSTPLCNALRLNTETLKDCHEGGRLDDDMLTEFLICFDDIADRVEALEQGIVPSHLRAVGDNGLPADAPACVISLADARGRKAGGK